MASSDKVELPHNNLTRGGHILHEQAYNTRHGVSAIPDAIRGKIWCEPSRPEVQQEPVVHLLLEDPLGRDGAVPGLPVQTPAQPSQSAHRGGSEADPGYAPQKPQVRYGGTVAPPAAAGLYPPPGELVPGHAQAGAVPAGREETSLQAKAL